MIRRQDGFTMVELLITMVIFVLTIAAATSIFVPLITQFKQQSKIAETQIEGVLGLDILRRDIEQSGFGLPWEIPEDVTIATYIEGSAVNTPLTFPPSNYNDAPDPPRAVLSGDGVGFNGSDYLVVKATSIATNDATMKWAYVVEEGGASSIRTWGEETEDLDPADRVIVMIPSRGENSQRILVNNGAAYSDQFQNIPDGPYAPGTENDLYLIYGVDPDTNLRMPFNRADYYIRGAGDGFTLPPRCATGTGILMKSVINQGNGDRGVGMPLLDCVADMQVIYQLDRDGDGTAESVASLLTDTTTGAELTAQQIREQLKEVRVYILAHEGQKDWNYTYPDSTVDVGEFGLGSVSGDAFNLTTIPDWQRYRWKVYRVVVKPNNLWG